MSYKVVLLHVLDRGSVNIYIIQGSVIINNRRNVITRNTKQCYTTTTTTTIQCVHNLPGATVSLQLVYIIAVVPHFRLYGLEVNRHSIQQLRCHPEPLDVGRVHEVAVHHTMGQLGSLQAVLDHLLG